MAGVFSEVAWLFPLNHSTAINESRLATTKYFGKYQPEIIFLSLSIYMYLRISLPNVFHNHLFYNNYALSSKIVINTKYNLTY